MSVVRARTLRARPTILGAPSTVTPPAATHPVRLLNDQHTLLYRSNGSRIACSVDNGSSILTGKDFTYTVDGGIETPNGELLVSVRPPGAPGEIWRSTGWNVATADATSWAKKLTCSGNDVYIRNGWGLSVAPSWSRHAGAIFACEYGLPKPTAYKAYMSTDDGVTWRQIFDLSNYRTGTNFHNHGCTYDPWQGRIYIAQGDESTADTNSLCGIWYSDNPEANNPRWTLVPGSSGGLTAGNKQVVGMMATEAGIICLGDGSPQTIRFIPRRAGGTGIGPVRDHATVSGDPGSPYIGGFLHRNGNLEDPQAGSPIWACAQEPGVIGPKPGIWVSFDGGVTFREAYRHSAGVSVADVNTTGIERVFGPSTDGKVVATINVDGTMRVLQFDYLPDAQHKRPSVAPSRLMTGRTRFDAATAQTTSMSEGGNAAAGGANGGFAPIYIDPADLPYGAKLRIRQLVEINDTAPGTTTFTAGLYPTNAPAGAAATVSAAFGTVVSGSTAAVANPAANSRTKVDADFEVPAAGWYALGEVISANMAASSAAAVRVELFVIA